MIVDSHPPVPTSAIFDPATMMRSKNGFGGPGMGPPGGQHPQQQQQARQRYWSGLTLGRPSSMQDPTANGGGKSGKGQPPQQWNTPAEKEIYTPFKSVSGRATPLDDPYSPNPRMMNSSANEYMPVPAAPQDPRGGERPPSRAMSMNGGGLYGMHQQRKSEGSVVYQPLTPTNHASAWSNSLMFNKPYPGAPDPLFVDHLANRDLSPLGTSPPIIMPPLPHIQTLPRQLPLARNANFGMGPPPEEPTHNPRQQVPQSQPFVTMNGYVPQDSHHHHHQQMHQHHSNKPAQEKTQSSGARVTLVPNGTVIGGGNGSGSLSSAGDIGDLSATQDEMDGVVGGGKRSKSKRRRRQATPSAKTPRETGALEKLAIVEKVAILHMLLGATLFAIGVARILLLSTWGLGIELVYGVYVVLMGMLGLIGCRRRHYCSVAASIAMSALSCLLAIPPFVIGLLVTIPDTFHTIDAKYFKSPEEPYGVDILLAVISLLELLMSVITAALGCSVVGRILSKWKTMEQLDAPSMMPNMDITNGKSNGGGGKQPIFHTSVNITHPGMMKH